MCVQLSVYTYFLTFKFEGSCDAFSWIKITDSVQTFNFTEQALQINVTDGDNSR